MASEETICELRAENEKLRDDIYRERRVFAVVKSDLMRKVARLERELAGVEEECDCRSRRNCDRFTNQYDAQDAWHSECCDKTDIDYGLLWTLKRKRPEFLDWLFSPATGSDAYHG